MNIEVIKLTADYIRPTISERMGTEYVMNGDYNKMYADIISAYYGSATNSAIINSYARMTYGMGLNIDQNFISKKDLKKLSFDTILFGESAVEIMKDGTLKHADKSKILPSKAIEGVIKSYWYSFDWGNLTKYPPIEIPAYGYGKKGQSQIYIISDYQVGQFYFNNPSYISCLPYCEVEIELANYYVNHIKNGLSFGHIINVNGGKPEDEDQLKTETAKIKGRLTGSNNSGKFLLSFNNNKDEETTVTALEVSNAHEQYQFLTDEAQNKICVAHKVVSGAILGINKASGFSSNADEIEIAFNETYINVIRPFQELIIDAIEEIKNIQNLDFIPLRQNATETAVAMSKVDPLANVANELFELGEVIDSDIWECIDESALTAEPTFGEFELQMSSIKGSTLKDKSTQDTGLFRIRYGYTGDKGGTAERPFCIKMMSEDKVYRKEDIEAVSNKVVNKGFGPEGTDTYSIWLYKGGVNCRHAWIRKIYLKKDNSYISVGEARKMVLKLGVDERKAEKLEVNDPLVAQSAQDLNNHFKLPK